MLAEKAEVLSSLEFGPLFSPDRRRSYPFHPSFVLVLSASGSRPLLLQPLKDYCVILLTPVPNTVRHCVMSLRLKAPSSHPLFHRLYFTSESTPLAIISLMSDVLFKNAIYAWSAWRENGLGKKKYRKLKDPAQSMIGSFSFSSSTTDNKPEWRDVLAFTTTRAVKTMPALVLLPELYPQLWDIGLARDLPREMGIEFTPAVVSFFFPPQFNSFLSHACVRHAVFLILRLTPCLVYVLSIKWKEILHLLWYKAADVAQGVARWWAGKLRVEFLMKSMRCHCEVVMARALEETRQLGDPPPPNPTAPSSKWPSAAIQCQLRSTRRHDSVPLRRHRCTPLSFCPSCWQLGNVAIFSSLLAGIFQHVFLCCLRKADLIKGPSLNPSHIFDVCEAWFKYCVEPELLRDERFAAGCDECVHPW